jgi:2-polyprenyl-6-methoxyphenol hydroxylase-like FAD-dependent oxidoreductase
LRFKPRHWRLISTLNPGESEQAALAPSSIDTKVAQLLGEGSHQQLWSSVFHIHCRTSPHFRQGRVLLAGDAAHINSPAGGQGMNSGIQDVHNLAWKLARVLAGADAESLLTSYETERRETVLRNVDRYNIDDLNVTLLARPNIPGAEGAYVASESLWQIWNPFWGLAALLRPDGHVGWMERRPTLAQLEEGVRKALGSIP